MPPAQIFIVRHGERTDHVNKEFSKTTDRPHDPPLTPNGVTMAEKLGAYLFKTFNVDPASVVVLCSPLQRCVQTADGFLRGMVSAKGGDGATPAPIYIEPSVAEGGFWMFYDMRRNPAVALPPDHFACPDPIFRTAAFHRANTSPLVSESNPYHLGCDPALSVKNNELVEEDMPGRCIRGAKALLQRPDLDGKTVFIVGHGETVLRWDLALRTGEIHSEVGPGQSPNYTSFTRITWDPSTKAYTTAQAFDTPHLAN